MYMVVPSLPAGSFGELLRLSRALEGISDEFQVDIVDGKFVQTVSWPFTEDDPIGALSRLTELPHSTALEIDCMVIKPEQYLDSFIELGIKRVIIHLGSTDQYAEIAAHAHTHRYKIGLAFTNDVVLNEIEPLIGSFDFVQIMGIAHVGKQGQPFDTRTLATAQTLRAKYPKLEMAVDGSVNMDTIVPLRDAGITRFAPGSAITKQEDPARAYKELCALVASPLYYRE